MPVLPVSHFEWQLLRTVKRNKKPSTGRSLRLVPNRRTKDGTFLNELVDRGLLVRAAGTVAAPFEATFSLTPMGDHAAEFGECDFPDRVRTSLPTGADTPKKPKKRS